MPSIQRRMASSDKKQSMEELKERVLRVCREFDKITAEKVHIVCYRLAKEAAWLDSPNVGTAPRNLSHWSLFVTECSLFSNSMIKLSQKRYNLQLWLSRQAALGPKTVYIIVISIYSQLGWLYHFSATLQSQFYSPRQIFLSVVAQGCLKVPIPFVCK